ncbi:hypothetical protein [Pseudoxanthomonas winnipegensis]|uniref:hypothetical protein n=1 Tax=Pseudoxanthomonas winnipegensis TaxID=2480810 RepID=UPI001038ADF9|nr:hypothetical protein [Pseudoxanthomonas winnipegensis]TBV76888.1 hypothetical protein EYC45_01600 [Pseudoxanthomonas winnipegensis]
MSQPITQLPIAVSGIADMQAFPDAAGARHYGVKDGADGYSQGGAAGGLATLGSDSKVPASQLPADLARTGDLSGLAAKTDLAAYAKNRNVVTALAVVSGVVTVNCALGDYFTLSPTANVTGWSFTNVPVGCSVMIRIAQPNPYKAVAAPTATYTTSSKTITTKNNAVDVLAMTTFDGGNSWVGTLANVVAGT